MKKWAIILACSAAIASRAIAAGFLESIPSEELLPAGLKKLTPAELAHLEALIERYKTTELTEVKKAAAATVVAVQKEADKKVAEAVAQAADAPHKSEEGPVAAPGKHRPKWFAALVTLEKASEKPEKEQALESELAGDFDGWRGRTVFKLQDGTQWRQQNPSDTYIYSPVLRHPKVKIKPAAMSGFWLEIQGVNKSVRVTPFKLN